MLTWFAKATAAAIVGGAAVLSQAVQGSSAAGQTVTGGEWIQTLIAAIIAGAIVFRVPNRPDTTV